MHRLDKDSISTATNEVRAFLERVTVDELQEPKTWPELQALVRVRPDGDVFPVRAEYGDENQYTIGTNYLTAEQPL